MLQFGSPPYLECSSKGERRLSAFYARIRWRNNRTIEEIYQAYKVFPGWISGLSIKEAKGRHPINMPDCKKLYRQLWLEYFNENPELYTLISSYNGFSDIFGQANHVCQAEEIYLISLQIKQGNS